MSEHQRDEAVDPDVAAGETALNWAKTHGSGERVAARSRVQRRRRQAFRRVAAGSFALVILAAAGSLWQFRPLPPAAASAPLPSSVLVVTPAKRLLPDGSVVELKEGATIEVNYGAAFRQIRLVQGEAHFTVVKNPDVPFIVVADGLEVRAVGTAFSVQMGANRVEVIVTEGRVAVDKPVASATGGPLLDTRDVRRIRRTLATVDVGNRVTIETATELVSPLRTVPTAAQSELLSWRVPRIELSGTPLSEALSVFNRYSPVPLLLDDPSLGDLKLSGVLRPDNPAALLHVLKIEFGLEAERRADGGIVLRRP